MGENVVREFRIHNLPNRVVWWLSRCGELEGSSAEDCARAILEREWRRFNDYAIPPSEQTPRGGTQSRLCSLRFQFGSR